MLHYMEYLVTPFVMTVHSKAMPAFEVCFSSIYNSLRLFVHDLTCAN